MKNKYIILFFLIICSGCIQGGKDASSEKDADTIQTHFQLQEYKLDYIIPFPQNSIVARRENLPGNLSMCIVDTSSNVSTLIFKIKNAPKDIEEAEKVVNLITKQSNTEFEVISNHDIQQSQFLNSNAWNFRATLNLYNEIDSVHVTFYGYIFKNIAFVATANSDTVSSTFFYPYIYGLKRVLK